MNGKAKELLEGSCYGIGAACLGVIPVLVVAWLVWPAWHPSVPTRPDISWEARTDPLPAPKFSNRVPVQGPCQ